MQRNNFLCSTLITLFLLTSCNLGVPNPPITVPPAAPTTIPTPELSAENIVSFDGMHISVGFNYPTGFEQGSINELVAKVDEPSAPFEPAYPQHARILFATTSSEYVYATDKGIRVFRVDEINAVDARIMESLNLVLAGQLEQRREFPRMAGADRMIDAQAVLLPFQNGSGYRFLVFKKFDASSLSDTSMTYLYQGLTQDGQYIVSFITTVDAPFLADLITNQAFSTSEETANYKTLVNDRLNAADPNQFNPPLTTLDALSASIVVIQK